MGRGVDIGSSEVGRGDLHGDAHRQAQAAPVGSAREPAHVGSPTASWGRT
jgi:hypothetical protein